ncbi:MAG TPA: rhodanese-like domain-containing protein, partial [Gemmatimonadales bacterium]|nr:rhodanese-like domain-containing protein [Gemmatimonadales bacterium]
MTTAWVAEHLKDRGLVIFQIGDQASRPAYDSGHVAGAQFLNPFSELSTPRVEGALSLELPSAERLDSVLESKGISNDSRIILYWAREYYSPTSRTLFTLEYAGLVGRVSIMDGGLEVWKQEGRPVTTDVPVIAPGSFTVHASPGMVADAEFVKAHLQDGKIRIVDARDSVFYDGRRPAQNGVKGHIPGAGSIPFGNMVDSNRVLTPALLKREFATAGVKDGQTVVTYCHIGQQATVVWFAARLLGYDAKLYDGSMQDWTKRELPLE